MYFRTSFTKKSNRSPLKKARKEERHRFKGVRSRGTLETEKPPIFGMIQRGGEVLLRMLKKVQMMTIEPLIKATIAIIFAQKSLPALFSGILYAQIFDGARDTYCNITSTIFTKTAVFTGIDIRVCQI